MNELGPKHKKSQILSEK